MSFSARDSSECCLYPCVKKEKVFCETLQHKNKAKYGETWDIVFNPVITDWGSSYSPTFTNLILFVFWSLACLPGLRPLRSRTSVIKSWPSSSKTTATSSTAATMEAKMASLGNYRPSSLSRYTYHLVVQVHFICKALNRGRSLKGI